MNDLNDRMQDVWGHIENMTPDELRAHILKIRAERRQIKMRNSVKKTVKQTSDAAKTRMQKMLSGMDAEAVARMLKDLK